MDVYHYKLKFRGPTHFGETGIDLENVSEWISSDTIFSAIINSMSEFYRSDEVNELIAKFRQRPPFILSSLFLFNDERYFLPRPLDDSMVPSELKRNMGKELKKLKWLEAKDFLKWITSGVISEEDIKKMGSSQEEYNQAFKTEIRPRVSLDRTTNNSNIYHAGYVHFYKNAGLYGIVAFNDIAYLNLYRELLTILGETGIGGEKTYGGGMFDVIAFKKVSDQFRSILECKTQSYTLLSLYHPSQEEYIGIEDSLSAYNVVRKRGWISSGRYALPLKRKSVGFLTEGSVFSKPLGGTVVDVTPDSPPSGLLNHRVYRYGYAFTAPLWSGL